jgi:hypothetical protein
LSPPPTLSLWQAAGYKHAQKVLAQENLKGCLFWWTPGSGKSIMVALLIELLWKMWHVNGRAIIQLLDQVSEQFKPHFSWKPLQIGKEFNGWQDWQDRTRASLHSVSPGEMRRKRILGEWIVWSLQDSQIIAEPWFGWQIRSQIKKTSRQCMPSTHFVYSSYQSTITHLGQTLLDALKSKDTGMESQN